MRVNVYAEEMPYRVEVVKKTIDCDMRKIKMHRVNLKKERLIYQWIEAELFNARKKFPSSDHAVLALCEEAGELARAVLNYKYSNTSIDSVRKEAIQVAAMAIRVITEGDKSVGLPECFVDYNEMGEVKDG